MHMNEIRKSARDWFGVANNRDQAERSRQG